MNRYTVMERSNLVDRKFAAITPQGPALIDSKFLVPLHFLRTESPPGGDGHSPAFVLPAALLQAKIPATGFAG